MISFRSVWLFVVSYLCLGPILSPLPLLGSIGGFVKLLGVISAGPLLKLHSCLLLGYAGLVSVGLMPIHQVRTPATLSVLASVSTVIPPLLSLMTCSPEFVHDSRDLPVLNSLFEPKGVSYTEWSSPRTCKELTQYKNITTIYKDSLPPFGPASREPSFLNPTTRFVWSFLGNHTTTSLKAAYYPYPNGSKDDRKKPGLLIFVHGGGWWTGYPTLDPFPCLVEVAHSQRFAAATVEYRLARNGWAGDIIIEDVKDAIKYLIRRYQKQVDSSRIVLFGSSAGAHLALLAAYQLNNEKASLENPLIAGVAAVSPLSSVKAGLRKNGITGWTGAWDEAGVTQRLCEMVDDCDAKLSPLEHASKYAAKTILAHAGNDEYYRPEHSWVLARKLSELGIAHVIMVPPLMPHAFEIGRSVVSTQMIMYALKQLMQSMG